MTISVNARERAELACTSIHHLAAHFNIYFFFQTGQFRRIGTKHNTGFDEAMLPLSRYLKKKFDLTCYFQTARYILHFVNVIFSLNIHPM